MNKFETGMLVRDRRIDIGLNQRELASLCGYNPMTIHRLEKGSFGSARLVSNIAIALGCTFSDLSPNYSPLTEDTKKTIGLAIREKRKSMGLKQAEACKKCFCNKHTYSKVERGECNGEDTIKSVASSMGLPIE